MLAVALCRVLLLQLTSRLPASVSSWKWAARLAMGLTLLYAIWEGVLAGNRYSALAQGRVRYRPAGADFLPFVIFLWVALVFFRQAIRHTPDSEQAGRWQKLWQPQGPAVHAARALALLSILPLSLSMMEILETHQLLSHDTAVLIQSLGILFTLSAFALVYLNYLPETTSFMVKLVGVTLAVMLAILGSVGWIVVPAYVTAYHNRSFVAHVHTLRCMPHAPGT